MDALSDGSGMLVIVAFQTYPYNIIAGAVVVSFGLYLLARRYVGGGVCRSKARLDGKTVIITGGNTGIGRETAIDLAGRNARVILACRSVEKGEKAAVEVKEKSGNDDVAFYQLDLASLTSVRQFAAKVLEEEPRIDILINNAGVMGCPYSKTEDGFEMQFAVNHLSHFLLTHLLLDRLKEAPSARIVVVTSTLYKRCPGIRFDDINSEKPYPQKSRILAPRGCYAHSKLANILFTQALAERLEGTKVTVNAISPGVCQSDLGRHLKLTIPVYYRLLFYIFPLLFFKTARQGAQTSIHCAVAEEMEGISGRFYRDCQEATLTTAAATDNVAADRLWQLSLKMAGLLE